MGSFSISPFERRINIVQLLRKHLNEVKGRDDLTKQMLTKVRRVLGFVQMGHAHDEHGWNLLMDTARIKEYFEIVKVEVKPTASTIKSYFDMLRTVYKLTLEVFDRSEGWPTDHQEVSHTKIYDFDGRSLKIIIHRVNFISVTW